MKPLIINKWNHENHGYQEELYDADKYNLKTHGDDMDEIINCPHCYSELPLGASFTSLEYHTPLGIGYCVCYRCHQEELKRKYKNY